MIEIITPRTARFRYAVFDFDGTLSLVREGWQGIMTPYFTEALLETPGGRAEGENAMRSLAREFIDVNTGKQTIYQCIELAQHIRRLGGQALDPQDYKDEYHHRLLVHIDHRLAGLRNGSIDPETLTVPGSYALLEALRERGVALYLASGTDENYVLDEAHLIGVDKYFDGRIYGARRDFKTFSKKMVIQRILHENAISGEELLGFGDGYVEIENVREAGGFTVGVASNESERAGIDPWKRERLLRAGANAIIPDFRELAELSAYLFD